MAEYHKIETLFERDASTFIVDPTKLKASVFGTIREWDVTEKIDGTNIRVMLSKDGTVSFGGRTDAANIHAGLIQYLMWALPKEALKAALWLNPEEPVDVVLYGEGYGAGIQKGGGLYRKDRAFILFDVLVSGQWWLGRDAVEEIAAKLGINAVPYLGRMTLDQIVAAVREPFPSKIGTATAEGVVARPIETLFDKRMRRIIIKLKTKDFVPGKR
jgi:ATP-dependent RNA circularization protein (DNA/RNA ligase family)